MSKIREPGRGWLTKQTALLFSIAVVVRLALSLVQIWYGQQRMPDLPLNNWSDFYWIYAHWLSFVQQGLLPYRDFYTYKYPPLFLYALYPFYVAGGAHAAAIPIVLSDAASAVVVYLIAARFGQGRIPFAAGLVYALSPFVLYEIDYLWLNSQPMTFFMLLAIYLMYDDRPLSSIASLAVAVMFRQEALFILPPYLLFYAAKYKAGLFKGVGIFVIVCVAISLPFLVIAPVDYIYSVNYFPLGHVINLGPLEPSLPDAARIVNSAPAAPNPSNAQGPAYASILGILNRMAGVLDPLLLALLAPALYVVRRSPQFVGVLCAYSLLACLTAYSSLVGTAYAYYFVPVYALIFACISNRRTLGLGVATAILCLVVPEGPFQVIPPVASLLVLTALVDRR